MDKTYRKFKKRSKQWTVFYHCSDLKVPRDRELLKAKFQKMSVLIEYRRLKFVFCRVLFLYNPRRATMDFRPREAPFFGDYFFRFGPIAFKFSHTSFQPKRRFLSIWSVNKKSIIRVLVIAS